MKSRALILLLSGALLTFVGTTIHARQLFSGRSPFPDPALGQVLEFKVKGSDKVVYITQQDRTVHWTILGCGIALFLLGVKGGALRGRDAGSGAN